MDARLIPLNAFIGLVSPPGGSWPAPLHDAGYELVALELPIDAGSEAKTRRSPVPRSSPSSSISST